MIFNNRKKHTMLEVARRFTMYIFVTNQFHIDSSINLKSTKIPIQTA